ncbi:hypothetical protein LJ737_07650 [Hymenobacter sp. 15J16-1T3B]|uniref:hypothetical protein n=1 Tax=Hymenobacter sp. 15J16-1T3B TaxID=2886941 RepID=UPI001D117502|nr:hypothetical protein [Hymenobacter sp. 15J16-1T3B]MCC3157108.1 hypothetical protein [Hymenobacter sp. 15J16-1T3B]
MNKLFFLPSLGLCLVLAHGATAGQEPTLNDRATTLTQQIAQKVPLNEAQFVKVRRLNLQYLSSTQDLKARLADNPAALDQQLAELQDRFDWEMAAILWPRQMTAYRQSRANMTALGSSTER